MKEKLEAITKAEQALESVQKINNMLLIFPSQNPNQWLKMENEYLMILSQQLATLSKLI